MKEYTEYTRKEINEIRTTALLYGYVGATAESLKKYLPAL